MDVLGQVLRSLVGDHPPNGWTALIALGVCLSWVATNWIRANHHIEHLNFVRNATNEQLAKLPDAPQTLRPPSIGKILSVFAIFSLCNVALRMDEKNPQPVPVSAGLKSNFSPYPIIPGTHYTSSLQLLAPDFIPDNRTEGFPVYKERR